MTSGFQNGHMSVVSEDEPETSSGSESESVPLASIKPQLQNATAPVKHFAFAKKDDVVQQIIYERHKIGGYISTVGGVSTVEFFYGKDYVKNARRNRAKYFKVDPDAKRVYGGCSNCVCRGCDGIIPLDSARRWLTHRLRCSQLQDLLRDEFMKAREFTPQARRRQALEVDPVIGEVESFRVYCKACQKYIKLNGRYCATNWNLHRRAMHRSSPAQGPKTPAKTSKKRKKAQSDDDDENISKPSKSSRTSRRVVGKPNRAASKRKFSKSKGQREEIKEAPSNMIGNVFQLTFRVASAGCSRCPYTIQIPFIISRIPQDLNIPGPLPHRCSPGCEPDIRCIWFSVLNSSLWAVTSTFTVTYRNRNII